MARGMRMPGCRYPVKTWNPTSGRVLGVDRRRINLPGGRVLSRRSAGGNWAMIRGRDSLLT